MGTALTLSLCSTICFFCAPLGCNQAQKQEGPIVDETHVKQLILNLPEDSQMRSHLERGDRGEGVRYAWMQRMKDLSVQRAKVFLDFTWRGHPVDIRVQRIAFFKTYDVNCAQISDPKQLEMIGKSGLEKELKEYAVARTARSDWTYLEHRPRASRGTATVEVVDDEWLPVPRPNLTPLPDDQGKPAIIVDGDVKYLQETLKSTTFSHEELDAALMRGSAYLDDECSIAALISAGANPNARNTDGETPLMFAAYSGSVHNVEALLKAGADRGTKNALGQTASDIARQKGRQKILSLLSQGQR